MNNVIFLKFYKKNRFPPGKWNSEPDYCKWVRSNMTCVALRDMSLGVWKGFVGVKSGHPLFGQTVEQILQNPYMLEAFITVYGGICTAGHLPDRYEEDAKKLWWVGVETSHGGDLYPLLKPENNPDMDIMLSGQTYKDLSFIRRETNKLALFISRVK